MNKYPDYIVEKVVNNLGCDKEDVYELTPYDVLGSVLNWEGMLGYEEAIKRWIEDIYNVDLDKASRWNKVVEQGCDIYYVDEESTEIEHGMVSDVYFKGEELDSFNVVFDNGDFEEIDAVGLGKHYFLNQSEAEKMLRKYMEE